MLPDCQKENSGLLLEKQMVMTLFAAHMIFYMKLAYTEWKWKVLNKNVFIWLYTHI